MIAQVLFIVLLAVAGFFAFKRFMFVKRNVLLGRDVTLEGDTSVRWNTMFRVALGQGKMFTRPLAAVLHLFVYVGFVIINIEIIEILIDGIFGTHRVLSFLGPFYNFLIGSFEILALLVLVAVVAFLARRNLIKLKRFHMREMTAWPKSDANYILIAEIFIMSAFLTMNAADLVLQQMGSEHYLNAGSYPVSQFLAPMLSGLSEGTLIFVERFCWWFHIIAILGFIVYLTYSKHLHIILAFPNTYYSKLKPAGSFDNLASVTREVRLMLDPNADPYAAPAADAGAPQRFGAKDVFDLNWVQLMNAYSCTECGRCTSECPANQTGKLLSPRKIMMDTRDRLEEVGKVMDSNGGEWKEDGKSLLRDYISEEELWACTSCNACTEACPVNINPLEIIVDLRRYLIMEESKSPESITVMFNNIENNGAPWAFAAGDRANWRNS
ncbi:MAG: 4Fe-4S dicluster domain-containing protein [Flavobacteriales bacterium]|jgi:ferredoxin